MKLSTFIFFIILISDFLFVTAQNKDIDLDKKTTLPKGSYKLMEVIEILNRIPEVNVVYNDNEIQTDKIINIDKDNLSIKEIQEIIQKNTPYELKINDDYIIIKKKKLSYKYKLSGVVSNKETGENMIGVNVYSKESMRGGVTNEDGLFFFYLSPGEYTIVFSYLGCETKEVSVYLYQDQEINTIMDPGNTDIEEVRITSQRAFFGDMDIGRTIETIDEKEIKTITLNNASDVLHARINGVWATKMSGAPGDHQKIRIRGISSLFGTVDPLYIVDGVPIPIVNLNSLGISDININDIENITVLKDASSTALYGYQGGNGVIIIDTKQGGDKEFNFSAKYGIQRFNKRYNLMNTKEFLATLDTIEKHEDYMSPVEYYPRYNDSICSIDWQDVIFKEGIVQEYQLSYSGNTNNIKYYISGNYFDHKGIISNSSYKRYTFASRAGKNFKKWLTIGVTYKTALQKNNNNLDNYGGNKVIFEGISKSPCYNCTPDALYYPPLGYNLANRFLYSYQPLRNKVSTYALIQNSNKSLDRTSHSMNGFAKVILTDDLAINLSSSLSFRKYEYISQFDFSEFSEFEGTLPEDKNYLSSNENYIVITNQFNLTYIKRLNYHNFKFIAGYRNYIDNVYWEVDRIDSDIERLTAEENIYTKGSLSIYGKGGAVIRTINSYIGHVNYSYKQKYFISFIANYDHLEEGLNVNVQDFFPSIAMNWDIAKEYGLNQLSWLDHFHLYVNWGQSGNYPLNGLSNDLYTSLEYFYGDTTFYGGYVHQLANHFLKHEKAVEYNIGTQIELFNSRAIISADYFFKTNNNLIIQRDIPYYYGSGRAFYNLGKLENEGIEIGIELYPVIKKDFTWSFRFNYSANNQYIKKLSEQDEISIIKSDLLTPDFIVKTNERLGSITGYQSLGKWTYEDELENNNLYIEINGMKYLNNDTSNNYLNENDKVIIGNSIPDFTWNCYHSFTYKNLSLDIVLYGVVGVDKYNATRAATHLTATNREINSFISDTILTFSNNFYYESSAFIEDASFVRLKTLTFKYQPKKKLMNKVQMTFSMSFDNLITLTKYSGYDPEATIYTDNNFSDNAIDRGAYPNPKAIYFGINLKF